MATSEAHGRDIDANTTVESIMSVDKRSSKQGTSKRITSSKGGASINPTTFLMTVTGRIESAEIFGVDDVYCKYNLAFGSDWSITGVCVYSQKCL